MGYLAASYVDVKKEKALNQRQAIAVWFFMFSK